MYNSPRIKIFNGVQSHIDIAYLIAESDCGIYPSRAEGWNLELLETMAMNKPVISTNYSAHTEYCTKDNCYLVEIDNTELANDGKAFKNQGNWAKIDQKQKDQFIDYMRYVYNNRIIDNPSGLETAKKLSWKNSAKKIMGYI
jgi:glycosyltransferase involved in cell wall biosynthesis